MSTKQYEFILTSRPAPGVGQITLNRPKALNALCSPLFAELNDALTQFDADDDVRALVLTGSERAFAAGADIKEMKDKEFSDVFKNRFLENWSLMTSFRKPIIAAVSGYALGGGCELALMCDIILASPRRWNSASGPCDREVTHDGTDADRPEHKRARGGGWGMVSRVVGEGEGQVVAEAVAMASTIASKSQIAVQAGKEAVNAAYEHTLVEGLRYERRLFHGMFATKDQKEGMSAFAEKRKPTWTHS
ncbi:putative enoyl-CoA hydratase, mitochondrial [Grifola frondosa]|uniref:Putative enoyl-CoA hydratase, mitochondrial n=1 Tax=Grifola frondosa TaxID=5627 RepID=A0A1C7LNZ1_GRIFR|nr:putative enoyl-CoA hydratase, mitochondrial [Grifola frondosa]